MSKFVTFEDAKITFRNFSGAGGDFNREGDRNFALLLSPEDADYYAGQGWNVKMLKPRNDDEDQEPTYFVKVKVKFGDYPPTIKLIKSNRLIDLDEETVKSLDWARLLNIDLKVNAYEYNVSGSTGITLYLNTMYVSIEEDELEAKYAHLQDSAQECVGDDCPVIDPEEMAAYLEGNEDE